MISESMQRIYVSGRGLARDKVNLIPNWIDERRFACLPERHEACERYDVPQDRFTFIYLLPTFPFPVRSKNLRLTGPAPAGFNALCRAACR